MAIDPPESYRSGASSHPGEGLVPSGESGHSQHSAWDLSARFLEHCISHEPTSQHKFNELLVRSNTGLGAEKATSH